jgi:hypothetical protein
MLEKTHIRHFCSSLYEDVWATVEEWVVEVEQMEEIGFCLGFGQCKGW